MNIVSKIWNISSKSLIYSYLIFIAISILNTFIEILSLLYIFPLLDYLVLNQKSYITELFFKFVTNLKILKNKDEIFIVLFFFIVIFTTKFIINFIHIFFSQKLQLELRNKFTNELTKEYLSRKYRYFANINSSILIRNIFQEVPRVILGVILNIFNLISEFMLIFSIIIVLFIYDFESASIVFLLLSTFGLIFILNSKKFIGKLAKKRLKFDGKYLKNIKETFDNIKIIKINRKEIFFSNAVKINAYLSFKANFYYSIVAQSPRVIFELLLVFIVLLVLIINRLDQNIIYTLAIYSVSSLRLIPAMSKVINSISNIRFDLPSLNILFNDLKNKKEENKTMATQESPLNFKNKIELKNISFFYNEDRFILNKINLKINKNDFISIVGEAGSGKSTLVDIISGLINPKLGKIYIDDKVLIDESDVVRWQKTIGYMPQSTTLFDMSIRDNIVLGPYNSKLNKTRLNKAIKGSELTSLIKKLKQGLNTNVGDKGVKISGGEMQRIALARTLYSESQVIILDEATSSLDIETEKKILKTLKKLKNKTVIFITHRTNNLKYFNKIYKIHNSSCELK